MNETIISMILFEGDNLEFGLWTYPTPHEYIQMAICFEIFERPHNLWRWITLHLLRNLKEIL